MQQDFCLECIRLGFPWRAYRKVYDASKMTQHTVLRECTDLLARPAIAARVTELQAIANRKLEVSVEKIVTELARIAFFDPRDLFDANGNPIPINELPVDVAAVIAGLDVEEKAGSMKIVPGSDVPLEYLASRVKKYKLTNKLQALEVLAKWKKMLVDRVETGKPGEFSEDEKTLEDEIRRDLVKAGLGKVVPIKRSA